jgi:hypothetical protein
VANPNIVTTSSIFGKTDVLAVGTAATAITSNSSSSGRVFKINSLLVANVGSSVVEVDVELYRGSTPYRLAKSLTVPTGSTAVVVGKENPLYLLEGDSLRAAATSAGDSEAICSYEEIS